MNVSLPQSLIDSRFAQLLLDKALKQLSADGVILPKSLERGKKRYALVSEAARHGLCVAYGEVPECGNPWSVWAEDHWHDLRLPPGLCDCHAHTQFAYCGRGIDFGDAADLSLALGVTTQCFTEHAFALYFPGNALKFYWQSDPDFVKAIWATDGRGRMKAYRQLVAEARELYGSRVKFGLELDLFGKGQLCLADVDRGGWDHLIGAIHEVEGISDGSTQAEVESAWMRDVERLLTYPIRILAHPFRYFPWADRPVPRHFYKPVAKMLAQAGVAAEINHHKNPFELDFFRLCLEEGVKLSLGSDAHITRDIADLRPHLKTLEDLGIRTADERARFVLNYE